MHLHGTETVRVCLGVQEGMALGKEKEEVEGKEGFGEFIFLHNTKFP
jgi:hypothetical protein